MGGASTRKKREKKKDFQKAKLKVGKTKAKADNFTDTSFKSRSIVLNQQSLTTSAPSAPRQFKHYLSLATTSKTDQQRRDALAYLSSFIAAQPVGQPLPLPTGAILPKLLPLILDVSQPVRTHLIKLIRLLPKKDVADRVESTLLYIRAGMTNLASSIRNDTLAILSYLLEFASDEVVTCPGGWLKTLKCFITMMGWATSIPTRNGQKKDGWSSATLTNSLSVSSSDLPRHILVFSQFLKAGLFIDPESIAARRQLLQDQAFCDWPYVFDRQAHMMPTTSNAYAHLNLFGAQRDEEGEMYLDCESRQRIFAKWFSGDVQKGVEAAKKAGGEVGRAGAVLGKVLTEGTEGFVAIDA